MTEKPIETSFVEDDVESSSAALGPKKSFEDEEGADKYYFEGKRGFILKLLSDVVFLLGSTLYLIMAIEGLEWYKYSQDIPDEVLKADDDWTWREYYNVTEVEPWEDDVLFQANSNQGSYVTREMALYFGAAMCFLLTGLIDLWRTREWFNMVMIVAASFGVASSMLLIKNERLAVIFNAVSVHLFALEAGYLLFARKPNALWMWIQFAEFCWLCGTLMDCVLSYFYVFRPDDITVRMGRVSVAAAVFWLVCAVIYVGTTIYLRVQLKKDREEEATSRDEDAQIPGGDSETLPPTSFDSG